MVNMGKDDATGCSQVFSNSADDAADSDEEKKNNAGKVDEYHEQTSIDYRTKYPSRRKRTTQQILLEFGVKVHIQTLTSCSGIVVSFVEYLPVS